MTREGTVAHACFAEASAPDAERVVDALRAAGTATIAWDSLDTDTAPQAMVFVDGTSRETLDRIASIAAACAGRLLAIWMPPGAEPTLRHCLDLLAAGAADIVALSPGRDATAVVSAVFERWRVVDDILRSDLVARHLIGQSAAWRRLLRQVIEAARFSRAPVLVTGETGTGKELVARLIHTLDAARRDADLIVVDCTTLAPELAGSELFGHERGAFTGAVDARQGAFALAHGGTLFLDEIGELSIALQGQLLRVIQERLYKRVGGNAWTRSDFRVVCATNRDLLQDVAHGRFRMDLYHRIAGVTCHTPPLRERVDDIPELANHFLCEALKADAPPPLSRAVSEYLIAREYPGNVRDLRLLMQAMARNYLGAGCLTVGGIPEDQRPDGQAAGQAWQDDRFEQAIRRALMLGARLSEIGRAAKEIAVRVVLSDAASTCEAARRLGISPRAVQARRSSLRVDPAAAPEAFPHESA